MRMVSLTALPSSLTPEPRPQSLSPAVRWRRPILGAALRGTPWRLYQGNKSSCSLCVKWTEVSFRNSGSEFLPTPRLWLLGQPKGHRLGSRPPHAPGPSLMGRLEYKHYVAQGGDWGSVVADVMARGASILHHRTPTVRCRKNDTTAPSSLCRHARVVRSAGDVSAWLWVRHYRGRSDAGSRKCSRFPAPDHYDG